MYVVIKEWMSGTPVADITVKYDMYEGNLTRIILKMTNLLEEWRNMATYRSDVDMLRRFDGAEGLLLREVVLPDSLYVRMR
jgi:superfamily II RNA helicase